MDVKSRGLIYAWLLGVLWVLCCPAGPARAGQVVVTDCVDQSRSGLGRRVVRALTKALSDKGVALMGYRQYVRRAKKKRLARRARRPDGIAKMARALSLDGVVTCRARRTGKSRYQISFSLHGVDGKVRLQRSFRNRKPRLASSVVTKLAADMAAELGQGPLASEPLDDVALVPLAPLEAKPAPAEPITEAKPGARPEVATKPQAASPALSPTPVAMLQKVSPPAEAAPSAEAELSARAAPSEGRKTMGVVPEVRITAGASMHLRAGLSPRYETPVFPGVRVEARAFLGSFLELPFLKDLGLDGGYDRGFGLSYSSPVRPEKLSAHEQHWAAGLVYRLDIEDLAGAEIPTGPTFLLRFGYGATENAVAAEFPDVLSAAYTYTYACLATRLWLVRSLLSAELTVGYLPKVWPADSLSGDGSGFSVAAAVDLELAAGLFASVGYEQIQFLFDEDSLGQTSDRYQVWFARVGWAYR